MHGKQPPGSFSEKAGAGAVDPSRLVTGTRVGNWRVLGRHEAGTFGVVYLAVHTGHEAAGPCALKLARGRGDARLAREVELLARVHHPNVPRLLGHGHWYGFPYVVMEWVEGVELYRWARLCNLSRRQVARLLAKLAGALAAVHAVGGAHRDMKGDNMLVRLSDGEPLLTDFGAGTWAGATPLTVGGPPGTPLYYSPERLHSHLNLLPPGTSSGAGPADDVYGLGVTAWRLLTDTYPFLELDEAQRTSERLRGRLPRAPHEVNPNVPAELSAWVLRMMAAKPEERPPAQEVARALEDMARAPEEAPLFAWETDPSRLEPGRRSPSRVEYELRLAVARVEQSRRWVEAEVARAQAEQCAPPPPEPQRSRPARWSPRRERRRTWPWRHVAWSVLALGALGVGLLELVRDFSERPSARPASVLEETALNAGAERDGGMVGVGDTALAASSAVPSVGSSVVRPGLGLDMPRKPLRGQKRAPCRPRWEVEINSGCWIQHATVKAPCGDGGYEWQGLCYLPVQAEARPAASEPP